VHVCNLKLDKLVMSLFHLKKLARSHQIGGKLANAQNTKEKFTKLSVRKRFYIKMLLACLFFRITDPNVNMTAHKNYIIITSAYRAVIYCSF
jgi:hypothetical protein